MWSNVSIQTIVYTMKAIKDPAIFLGQDADDAATLNSLIFTRWTAEKSYLGMLPLAWASRLIEPTKATQSKNHRDELTSVTKNNGIEITELSTPLQRQFVAVHPAYDHAFVGFAGIASAQ
jgi:hypothetical protein